MRFLFPMGLLGLIAIPVIILIYILQSRYTEQTVNSTYLWTLSEKFMKRKNPLSGITGIISLILQILLVIFISLALSRPIITLPNAAKNYYFVLDASSSMNTVEGETSRYEIAKDEIEKAIKKTSDGSTYSLVTVSGETVSAFENVKSKKTAIELVQSLQPTHKAVSTDELLRAAQTIFDGNSSSYIYLVTDKGYDAYENVEIIDVGNENEDNYAIFNMEYSHIGGKINVSADIISYVNDKEIIVDAYVDGVKNKSFSFKTKKGITTKAEMELTATTFESITLEITNADGYTLDNKICAYNTQSDKSYDVLIVSDTGFFFKAVIDALVDSKIDVVSPYEYETVTKKYGLYIFDSYSPTTLPNGAVWLINSDRSIENSGFSVRGKVEIPNADVIEKSKSTATGVRKLLDGISDGDIYVTDYVKYGGMYLSFYTLFTYDSNPLIFAGSIGLGNRQVVFGFDLHKSDFALTTDFIMLTKNLLEYSFPDVIDETLFTVGDEVVINIVANSSNLKAISPSGKDIFMDADGVVASLALDEVGTYKISLTIGGAETTYSLYSGAIPSESEPCVNEPSLSLSGERTESNIDGEFDPLTVLFICMAVIFVADWGVYCYEKYQLR